MAEDNELRQLQKDCGIPNMPTQLTYELRLAVSGKGPRAYDWSDKPHRLLYDACRELERLATQAHEPGADVVEVRKVETVTGDFMQDEGEPFWRIEIGGYCADFDHEQAARNFAAAIAAMRPESERVGIVAWLRGLPNYEWYPDHVADAIERGDHIKWNDDDTE